MNLFQKSESIKAGLRKSFQGGNAKMAKRKCYGYNIDSHGDLIIDPEAARVVQWIFKEYAEGKSLGKIAAGCFPMKNILGVSGFRKQSARELLKLKTMAS